MIVCAIVSFCFIFGATGANNDLPVWVWSLFPLWMLFVFTVLLVYMRRSAEGFSEYIGLVVERAFSQPK